MVQIGDESGGLRDGGGQVLTLFPRKSGGRPTATTDQMLMTGIFGQVVYRRPVTHVRMGEQSRVLQRLQGAIHGGPVETGPALGSSPVIDVGGSEVLVVSRRHDLADGTSGVGDSITPITKGIDQLVGCDVHQDRLSADPKWSSGRR
jgi:hypothetical protein